jgi:hypothetical protein
MILDSKIVVATAEAILVLAMPQNRYCNLRLAACSPPVE